ncbi:MAG: dicarboxylate/amino acid:cation symporter [Youngiibacter sp.]|nr:dicarboxylate/amino acid:cation symporter [Youngiibacter sp.]
MFKKISLFQKIMIGFALGVAVGFFMGPEASMFQFLGTIMIRLLKLVVAPLIMFLMISTLGSVSDMKSFGGIAVKTIVTYAILTLIAIGIGLSVGLLFNVGAGANIDVSKIKVAEAADVSFIDTFVNMIPENIFAALAEPNLIQIIVFSLVFAFALTKLGNQGARIIAVFGTLADAMKGVVNIVLEYTPIGVFGLMANVIGNNGISIMIPFAKVIAAVYVASFIQTVFVHAGIIGWLICKVSPKKFIASSKECMTFAFATCSSVATIPLALKATKRLGVPDRIGNFIITIGSNMSMDGIAIYQGVAVVFASRVFGIELSITQYIMVMLASTVASLGVAGVPGSGLIVLTIVLQTVGLPLEAVGLLAGVDRILNMGRIIPNVTADIATSCLVSKMDEGLDPNPILVD